VIIKWEQTYSAVKIDNGATKGNDMSKASEKRKTKAVELAAKYTPDAGRVLEVSCGTGNELLRLRQAGYEVTGTNYTKYEGESSLIEIRHGVDLLQGLPFEDASFDTVILLDVIEHLPNHGRAISELTRVCKPCGHIIIMTPNIMKLTSRVEFLLTGFFKSKRAFIGFDVSPELAFAFHNYPVHLPILLYQLHACGLCLAEFTASVYKKKSFAFYVVFWPLIALTTRLKLRFGEKNLKDTIHATEMRQCLTSAAGLCGEFLFAVARRDLREGSASAEQRTGLPKWSMKWETEKSADDVTESNAYTSRR